jgi:hypothetical protein
MSDLFWLCLIVLLVGMPLAWLGVSLIQGLGPRAHVWTEQEREDYRNALEETQPHEQQPDAGHDRETASE